MQSCRPLLLTNEYLLMNIESKSEKEIKKKKDLLEVVEWSVFGIIEHERCVA